MIIARVAAVLVRKLLEKRKREQEEEQVRRNNKRPRSRGPKRQRTRRLVAEVHDTLGPYFFRRAYRMTLTCFKSLVDSLAPYLGERKMVKANINGPITNEVRVATALRYFAGGSPYDLCTTFGIAHSEVFESVWLVVDAVMSNPAMIIDFPESHDQQQQLARKYETKSGALFDCCVGAIDGILVWTRKPTKSGCLDSGCDPGKFMCGRKKKFGINCQAICDADGRFLAVGMRYPGSTADCLAFEGMSLHGRLENGLLKQGLCLLGDNAYINTMFMAIPYQSGNLTAEKDAYNFYHSQLRMTIECAFGRLTQRWGILRTAFSHKISVKKVINLTLALFRLENFCFDQQQREIAPMLAQDVRSFFDYGEFTIKCHPAFISIA